MLPITFSGFEDVKKPYTPWDCSETQNKTIPHKKLEAKCFNETKLNCVTIWKDDEYGNSVIRFDYSSIFRVIIIFVEEK